MKRKIAVWILIVAVLQPGVLRAQVATLPNANATAATAANAVIDAPATPIQIVVGRSTVLDIGVPITRVSLTNADIADAMVTSASQLLLHGKTPGTISMFVWERAGAVRRYDVSVGRDVARLAEQMKEMLPKENVQVTSNGRNVVLSGSVSTKDMLEKAVNLATSFVERKEEVVSVLQIQSRPSNQVLLKVRFAEVSRTALTELGLSLFTSPTGINNTLGRITTQQFSAPGFQDINVTKSGNNFGDPVTSAEGKYTFGDFLNLFILSEKYDLGVLIRALSQKGLFQSLAEPNLVAESGKEASFLAGGEFPIPVAQAGAGNAITVEFKEFGVRLNFTPVVDGDRVHLKVRPEVSTLDFANGIQLTGFRIPALVSRRTETELELRNGQTFAIAGLLNNSMTETLQRIPGIGDIPILGYLFRSKAAQKNRTELVVMITPVILQEDSAGVTRELPRQQEPYLSPLKDNEAIAPPPEAFPLSSSTKPAGVADGLVESTSPSKTASAAAPAPLVVQSGPPELTAEERRALDRARKEDAERAAAEARAQQQAAEAERRFLEEERKNQEKLAKEQAKRDAEEARKKAEADRKAADEARRQAEADKKKQEALDAAAAKVRAAEAAYQAELEKNGAK